VSEAEEELSAVAVVAMRRLEETEDPEEQAMLWQLLSYAAGLERQLGDIRAVVVK
jgi:hypothetical protein